MTVWPVLTLGNDRERVHTEGAAEVETFIRNTPDAELLAVHFPRRADDRNELSDDVVVQG